MTSEDPPAPSCFKEMGSQLASSGALVVLCAVFAAAGCGSSSAEPSPEETQARTTIIAASEHAPKLPLPKGAPSKDLVLKDLRLGWGVKARNGDELTTKFVAKRVNGDPFESSWDPGGVPFSFRLGANESSPGWEKGLPGMRVGGRRELIIPPDMASRFGPLPPEDTLVYVVELLGVAPPELEGRKKPDVVVPPGPPPKKLRVRDLIPGRGPEARSGDIVTMNYVSRHYTGKPFSNSWDDGHPFRIHLGAGTFKSIPGWEKGLPGMRVGGRREIIVPPDLIYQGGAPADSKPSETLVYVIDLIGITDLAEAPNAPGA
jgi:peptidylprolyl isomerase